MNEVRSEPPASDDELRLRTTRTSTVWTLVAIGLVLALLMLVFVAQNGERVQWEFLWLDFTLAGGLALLFAAVAGGLVVILVGAARLLQVRLAASRHRRADRARTPASQSSDGASSAGTV